MNMFDVIIIGAGPAGITAGIYARRAGLNVLILYYGESNLEKAERIENYYGFEDGIEGKKLYETGIKQAKKIGIEIKKEEVLNIEKASNLEFRVETLNSEYKSKTVIIATGDKKLKPEIKNIEEFEGKGVSYCAVCDGFFYRNKNVAVIGDGNYAISEAEYLKNIVNNVIILSDGKKVKENRGFEINTNKIKEICGKDRVDSVEFEDGSIINIDGIFIALGEASGVDFAKKIGIKINDFSSNIVVNEKMQTNVEGLFACGNVSGGLFQVSKAVYEGTIAGMSAIYYLKNIK